LHQLVVLPTVKRQYWYTVLQLEYVGVRSIVYQHQGRQVPIDYPQVLRIYILVDLYTVSTVQSVLYKCMLRVYLVQHHVSVGLVTSSEGNYLVVLRHPLKETYSIGPYCYVGLCC
jgi:hypothetical protein